MQIQKKSQMNSLAKELLVDAAVWYPSAPWTEPTSTSMETPYGNLQGQQITATVTSDKAYLDHFEIVDMLTKLGFESDPGLAADGPGASSWGYIKNENGEKQIMLFSYKTQPSSNNPNEPLQFDCPCKIDVTVFVSNPFGKTQNTGMANPASVNCEKVGGTLTIQELGNGAQYGLCNFEDNMSCEEWALLHGDCPVGGVKTTGFDSMGQMYCAWLGGQTLAVANSQCTLPNGTVCATNALYAGTCPSN